MARYNRNFLVPYLHDICALYLADDILDKKIDSLRQRIRQLEKGKTIGPPDTLELKPGWSGGRIIALIIAVCCIWVIYEAINEIQNPEFINAYSSFGSHPIRVGPPPEALIFLTLCCGGISTAIFLYVIPSAIRDERYNVAAKHRYKKYLHRYQESVAKIEQQNELGRTKIPTLRKQVNYYTAERHKVSKLLQTMYAANIIPSKYRDFYAAIYLYDFFSTGGSDDLDMALNLYVLEQIKDRLDRIIANQSTIILNQRMMLANQHRAIEEQREHNDHMKRMARRIASNMEEQTQYLRMTESNTAATAYFAAANYLKR